MECDENVCDEAPSVLQVSQYVEQRSRELQFMWNELKNPEKHVTPMQKLPRHMRRRAASHKVKRLPQKIRAWANKEMAKAPPNKPKRPSRKYRRRPKNLQEEYNRRQRTYTWLETHIWHAKRFHMTERWGYKIPLHPNDKGARAAYRATAKYCLLQDISYHCCIEIQGPEQRIISALARLTSQQTGLTAAASAYLSGAREGVMAVYACDQYPLGCLGEVRVLWRQGPADKQRQLWLWTHPATYPDLFRELRKALGGEEGMDIGESEATVSNATNAEVAKREETSKESSESSQMEGDGDQTQNEAKADCKEPSAVSQETFVVDDVTVTSLKDALCRFHLTGPLSTDILYQTLRLSEGRGSDCETEPTAAQKETWDTIHSAESPAELPPNCVLGLTVQDPRLVWPSKKSMVAFKDKFGSEVRLSEDEDVQIPVLLIQNPGDRHPHTASASRPLGSGSGWDLVLPPGWAKPFLLALVYRGARVAGLKEIQTLSVEQGRFCFPNNYPDTPAGAAWELSEWKAKQSKYDRIPPAKRPNFHKLGVLAPYHFPWASLLSGCLSEFGQGSAQGSVDKMYVLRNRAQLRKLQAALQPNKKLSKSQDQQGCLDEIPHPNMCLVPVEISVNGRGTPEPHSLICLPTEADLQELLRDKSAAGPVEPIHKRPKTSPTKDNVKPPDVTDITKSCSRTLVGFVKDGSFVFTSGQGFGLGFVTLHALRHLLKASLCHLRTVLIRSPVSTQYRYAQLSVAV